MKRFFATFSSQERWFFFFALLSGFLIAAEYGVTRPASQSLFLHAFSVEVLPWVWLCTVPCNFLTVYLYSRYLPLFGPWKMLLCSVLCTIGVNTATYLFFSPPMIFLQYVWKDIYILLLFKQLWSLVHGTVAPHRAKYFYGILFGMGTLGSIVASLLPTYCAVALGSKTLYLCTLPLYGMLLLTYFGAYRQSPFVDAPLPVQKGSGVDGLSLISKNRSLQAILALVVLMQASIGFIEYQFHAHLQIHITDVDLRTAYYGKLVGWMNSLSGVLQLLGGAYMLHTLGMRKSHFSIPLVLLLVSLLSWGWPSFAFLSLGYVFVKSVDFSLFGVLREMLYVSLKIDEQFRAKAFIDVFAHRTAKAFVSLALLGLQAFLGEKLLSITPYCTIAIFLLWVGVVGWFFRYPSKEARSN